MFVVLPSSASPTTSMIIDDIRAAAHTTTPRLKLKHPSPFLDPCTSEFIMSSSSTSTSQSHHHHHHHHHHRHHATFCEKIKRTAGNIYEVLTKEQFASEYDKLNEEAGGGPRAFCGAVAPTTCLRLGAAIARWESLLLASSSSSSSSRPPRRQQNELLMRALAEATVSIRENFPSDVLFGLREFQRMRSAANDANPHWFNGDEKAIKSFKQNWIANYEISDFVKMIQVRATAAGKLQQQLDGGDGSTSPSLTQLVAAAANSAASSSSSSTTITNPLWRRVAYCRANQFPELSAATPDEHVRILAEETSFGGVPLEKNSVEKPQFLHGDASCYLEVFSSLSSSSTDVVVGSKQGHQEQEQSFLRLFPANECRCHSVVETKQNQISSPPSSCCTTGQGVVHVTSTVASFVHSTSNNTRNDDKSVTHPFPELPFACIVDLKGHYACAVFFEEEQAYCSGHIKTSGNEQTDGDDVPLQLSMILFNSMKTSIVQSENYSDALSGYFDMIHAMWLAKKVQRTF